MSRAAPMWVAQTTQIASGHSLRFAIERDSSPVTYADILTGWQTDAEFRAFFIALLREAPFAAYRWETPPVTRATVTRPFEFVLLDSPFLAGEPDASAFAEHFATARPSAVIEFPNLGHDAIMIVPCPADTSSDYGHLAAFLRNASSAQQHALWESVGAAMQRRLSTRPVWLSTAGGGVAWLHVRLDDRPKYYGYTPYRHAS